LHRKEVVFSSAGLLIFDVLVMKQHGPILNPSSRSPPTSKTAIDDNGVEPLRPAGAESDSIVASSEIENALVQTIATALDFANWEQSGGFAALNKAQEYLKRSIREQERVLIKVRKHLLSALRSFPDAPDSAGVYRVSENQLRIARRSVLLPGKLVAARGASVGHDSLVASLVSVGICLIRYDGKMRSWRTIFLRHDCDVRSSNPVDEILAVLDRRARRSSAGPGASGQDSISRLMRRAFQSAAERKSLLEQNGSGWCMGYGLPAPYELLTGSGSMDLIEAALPVLESLLLGEKRWIFVPDSLSNRAYATLAAALHPGELVIIQKAKSTLDAIVERGHYESGYQAKVRQFVKRAGEEIIIGGFRATRFSSPQLFFAHAEHALQAGLIAMADAALQPHRGFPLLLELAGISAKVGLGIEAFQGMIESTYASAGAANSYSDDRVVLPESNE
jgi:hypothetical protein